MIRHCFKKVSASLAELVGKLSEHLFSCSTFEHWSKCLPAFALGFIEADDHLDQGCFGVI